MLLQRDGPGTTRRALGGFYNGMQRRNTYSREVLGQNRIFSFFFFYLVVYRFLFVYGFLMS